MPARKRPIKTQPEPPQQDVVEKQDPDQTVADFLRDLERVATDDADERLKKHGEST